MTKKIHFIILFIFIFFFSLFTATALAQNTTCNEPITLTLQVPFGALAQTLTIDPYTIGNYIKAIYVISCALLVVIAIIMIMVSGLQWITSAGEAEKINKAKDRLIKALTGLFIGLFAIFILRLVNPATTVFGPLQVSCVLQKPAGSAPENAPCSSSAECKAGFFCAKSTKVCTAKYPSTNDDSGLCAGAEISGNDNLACQSNDCITPGRDIAGYLPFGCEMGHCCGSGGYLTSGTACTAQNCGTGLYCNAIKKVCEEKNKINGYCNSSAVMGGNADLMCDTNSCSTTLNVCIYINGTYAGEVGDACTDLSQCKSWYCKDNKCSLIPTGEVCARNDQCESGFCDCTQKGPGESCYCHVPPQ